MNSRPLLTILGITALSIWSSGCRDSASTYDETRRKLDVIREPLQAMADNIAGWEFEAFAENENKEYATSRGRVVLVLDGRFQNKVTGESIDCSVVGGYPRYVARYTGASSICGGPTLGDCTYLMIDDRRNWSMLSAPAIPQRDDEVRSRVDLSLIGWSDGETWTASAPRLGQMPRGAIAYQVRCAIPLREVDVIRSPEETAKEFENSPKQITETRREFFRLLLQGINDSAARSLPQR